MQGRAGWMFSYMRLFCIITRFWCGRQELKTYDDMKKALIFKAFLLLNANVNTEIWRINRRIDNAIELQKGGDYGG